DAGTTVAGSSNGVYGPTALPDSRIDHGAVFLPNSIAAAPTYFAVFATCSPARLSPSGVTWSRYVASVNVQLPDTRANSPSGALTENSTPCRRLRPPLVLVSRMGSNVCSLLTSVRNRAALAPT